MTTAETDRFRHLLDALSTGCPPHGGIALGLDRLVAIIANATSIKDVIAFPKSNSGQELMVGSPSQVPADTQRLYHIQTVPAGDGDGDEE